MWGRGFGTENRLSRKLATAWCVLRKQVGAEGTIREYGMRCRVGRSEV